jgi:intraflagellar transport protein 52
MAEEFFDNRGQGVDSIRVLFSSCKNESHTPKTGYTQVFKRLRSLFKVEKLQSREELTFENLRSASIVVFGGPKERFTNAEFDVLKRYLRNGGSLLVLLGEGGEARSGTNINYLLEEFGISINKDSVVRTVHYKYLHPKEVLISDGILNRTIVTAVGKKLNMSASELDDFDVGKSRDHELFNNTGLDFVYPYGATLSVQKPAVPLLSSGKIAYPMHRPLGE